MSDTIEHEDLADKVYNRLKSMILEGELAPGEKLRQEELSARLGVSRTPVVTAISRLSREVLVEILPRRGARVRLLSRQEILDLYDIRIRLEPLGARQAAVRRPAAGLAQLAESLEAFRAAIAADDLRERKRTDFGFHMGIMKMSGNFLLCDIVESHNLVFVANLRGIILAPATSLADHEAMLAAIGAGDPAAAERAMKRHLQAARDAWAAAPEIGGDRD